MSSWFLHGACWAAAVCSLHLQMLSFILILVVCPDTKPASGFSLVHKVLGRVLGLGWMVASSDWLAHLAACEHPGLAKEDPIATIA